MQTALKTDRRGAASKRRRGDPAAWEARVAYAVKRLDDPIALSASPLTRLKAVEQHAVSHYRQRLCSRAFALRDLLKSSIDCVIEETAQERGLARVHRFLTLFREGHTVSEISRQLGLSREHVSRVYRKAAFRLVTLKFLQLADVRGTMRLFGQ